MGYANEFSWSFSRSNLFNNCKRAYYYNYYASHNGWDWNAAPGELAFEAYRLKKLTNKWGWLGSAVHTTAAQYLKATLAGKGFPVEQFVEDTMRSQWAQSLDKGPYRPAHATKLYEHVIEGTGDMAIVLEQSITDAKEMLRTLVNSRLIAKATTALKNNPAAWRSIERLESFSIDGTKVWVVMDFCFLSDKGKVCIVDWKTGKAKPIDAQQLAIYAMFTQRQWMDRLEDIVLVDFYLKADNVEYNYVSQEDIDGVKEKIRASVEEMSNYVVGTSNTAKPISEFEKASEDITSEACKWCNFRPICYGQIEVKEPEKHVWTPSVVDEADIPF